jgi:DNA polymerase
MRRRSLERCDSPNFSITKETEEHSRNDYATCFLYFLASVTILPGRNEDREGVPLIGAAGKMFDSILNALHLTRGVDAYVSNVCKCRPPQNRTPLSEERETCFGKHLKREMGIVKPKLIVCMGKTAITAFFPELEDLAMKDIRNSVYSWKDITVIATYHPAYLVYNQGAKLPEIKKQVWSDIMKGYKEAGLDA